MAYIGREPQIGNYSVLDALTTSSTNSYTMQLGSTNFIPESANHLIVSLNGVIQKPGSSFTVSGSTITFILSSGTLSSSDSIDFIIALGNVLDIGTPSDNTIATAKIIDDAVTAAKFNADVISGQTELAAEPADTDEFLVSDAGVLKRIDYSHIKGGGMDLLSTTSVANATSVTVGTFSSTYSAYKIIIAGMTPENTNQDLYFTFIKSDGSEETGTHYRYTVGGFRESTTSLEGYGSASAQSSCKWARNVHNNTGTLSADILITNPQQSIRTSVIGVSNKRFTNDAYAYAETVGCFMDATTSYTQIKFYPASGPWNAVGKIMVYGLKE